MTSIELGKRSYTSQTSIMRFYKKLGFRTYREFISTLNIERNELFKIQDISTQNFSQYFTSFENVQTTLYQIYDLSMTKMLSISTKSKMISTCVSLTIRSIYQKYGSE